MISIVPIDDGDSFTAASIYGKFSAFQSAINDLDQGSIMRGAFQHVHLPGFAVDIGATPVTIGTNGVVHTYDASGWQEIEDSTGAKLRITPSTPPHLGMNLTPGVWGLLILANVEVWKMYDAANPVTKTSANNLAAFRLEWFDGTSWAEVPGSAGSLSQDLADPGTAPVLAIATFHLDQPRIQHDFPLLGHLTSADVSSTKTVEAIRVVCNCLTGSSGTHGTVWASGQETLELKRCNLSVIALHAGNS
jgi:hypothetical protein